MGMAPGYGQRWVDDQMEGGYWETYQLGKPEAAPTWVNSQQTKNEYQSRPDVRQRAQVKSPVQNKAQTQNQAPTQAYTPQIQPKPTQVGSNPNNGFIGNLASAGAQLYSQNLGSQQPQQTGGNGWVGQALGMGAGLMNQQDAPQYANEVPGGSGMSGIASAGMGIAGNMYQNQSLYQNQYQNQYGQVQPDPNFMNNQSLYDYEQQMMDEEERRKYLESIYGIVPFSLSSIFNRR